MTVKAIQTRYKGYHFRSRLEARWAVFFDALGIQWEYEPEGFEKRIDGELVRYLPDFWLPDSCTWVEVKGRPTIEDAVKMAHILDYGSPLTLFDGSKYPHEKDFCDEAKTLGFRPYGLTPGLLLLGEIPDSSHSLCIHPLITHYKGLHRQWVQFTGGGLSVLPDSAVEMLATLTGSPRGSSLYALDAYGCSASEMMWLFDPRCVQKPAHYAYEKVKSAYAAARSARFEFGQSGAAA